MARCRAAPEALSAGQSVEAPRCRRALVVPKAVQISVCQNRTCKKQGSQQILKILEDVEHEGFGINVRGCGCLGQCGSGPNICISPPDVNIRGIGTPAAAFRMLQDYCNVVVSDSSQRSVQLRLRGNDLAAKGQYDEALQVYQEALQHVPAALAYKLHSNMSLLALTSGDVATALSEASVAMEEAPSDFTTAKVRMVEACLAAGDHDGATRYLEWAVRDDASFRQTLIFRELVKKVQASTVC